MIKWGMNMRNDKRLRYLSSAKKLFLTKGYNNTTLHDIAADAGLPLGNLYYYHSTKLSLLKSVLSNIEPETKAIIAKQLEAKSTEELQHSRLVLEAMEQGAIESASALLDS